jgi:hypothetical protein
MGEEEAVINKNKWEGEDIEDYIARIFKGRRLGEKPGYDLDAGKRHIEVKSFYFFVGKAENINSRTHGKIKIYCRAHEKNRGTENFLYVIVGKVRGRRVRRLVFVLTWDEMDEVIRRNRCKERRFPNGMDVYELYWTQLLCTETLKKLFK